MHKHTESFPGFFIPMLPVPGQMGPGTKFDRTVAPAVVTELEILFDSCPTGPLFESFPALFGTREFSDALLAGQFTGFSVEKMTAKKADQYHLLSERKALPEMVWLKVTGDAGKSDFGYSEARHLVVSGRVLELAKRHGLTDARIYDATTPPTPEQIDDDLREEARQVAEKLKSRQKNKHPWFGNLFNR
jgi:hypothetical protein